jgi:two-component system, response regulator PhcR
MIFCDRIMRSFGGTLSIDSAQGVGTTVTMGFGAPTAPLHAPGTGKPGWNQSSLITSR